MAFNFSDGNTLSSKYLKESDLIDEYIGNRLWNWGHNDYGQLGNNSRSNSISPVQTISGGTNWKSVSSSGSFYAMRVSHAIKTDGTLWSWGDNRYGQLGTNDTTNRSSPVQTVSGGTNWKLVSAGRYNAAAIKTDGSLWLWGYNNYGTLGNNNQTQQQSPVQTIASGTNWQQVSITNHTLAIKTDGSLWLWGRNQYGQLGTDNTTNRSSPVQTVSSGTNWKQVSCGYTYSAAIKTDGTLWLWGGSFNNFGFLGDNTTTNKSSPVQTVAGGTNWKLVSSGFYTTSAIKTDGSLWAWGRNEYGQLGTDNTTNRSSPVQTVAGGTNWKLVETGAYHLAAIKTDGSLWLWGRNQYGQLGTNDTTPRSSPIQTVSGGTNWKQLSAGGGFTSAVTFSDQQ